MTVVGLARSGTGAANLLAGMGAAVTVTDSRSGDEMTGPLKRLAPSVRMALGGHPDDLFTTADLIVVSPGVPLDIKPLMSARARGIPVISELELAFQVLDGQYASPDDSHPVYHNRVPFLAVTGTNGKSTTSTLLDYMLRKSGYRTLFGGNIGNALSDEILNLMGRKEPGVRGDESGMERWVLDFAVAEVSSFQLEAIDTFRPFIAAILNITPDHLDRYDSFDEYGFAKSRIFANQLHPDFLVLNADDPMTMEVSSRSLKNRSERPGISFFSRKKEVEGVYYRDGQVWWNFPDKFRVLSPHLLLAAEEIRIKGVHNLENAMAASAMALLAGCPVTAVIDSLREFEGLEHRLESVRELDGVLYINDSKGTNVGAVMKSLESFRSPLILIAGGRDKKGDFSALGDLVAETVKALVLIGEASGKIKGVIGDRTQTLMAKDLEEAVNVSSRMAEPGDVVLLSPGCASFDMFRDYEERGREFKRIVMKLEAGGHDR